MILIIVQIIAYFSVNQIKKRTIAIRQCLLMIDNIEILLSYENLNTYEIFKKLYKSNLYSELNFISNIFVDYNTDNDNYILSNKIINCIDSSNSFDIQDKTNIKGFLSMLGKSDLDGQILNCRMYKEFFKNKLEKVEQSEHNRCKSTYTLISGIGILFIIVIL